MSGSSVGGRAPPFLPYGRQTIEDDDVAAVAAARRAGFLTTGPTVEAFEAAVRTLLQSARRNGVRGLTSGSGHLVVHSKACLTANRS
jgi:dTDP-4-amino-4,6-dideoxygalactose transaminase